MGVRFIREKEVERRAQKLFSKFMRELTDPNTVAHVRNYFMSQDLLSETMGLEAVATTNHGDNIVITLRRSHKRNPKGLRGANE